VERVIKFRFKETRAEVSSPSCGRIFYVEKLRFRPKLWKKFTKSGSKQSSRGSESSYGKGLVDSIIKSRVQNRSVGGFLK
jgi:hypothetical protein